MRLLNSSEIALVAGGEEPTELPPVVVVGRRVMTDAQIEEILERHYSNLGWSSAGGGGGGGGTAYVPPPVIHVWEEDTDGDGQVDTLWIDNDGDGQIGAGDGAAFLDNGPWTNLDAFQLNAMSQGLQSWAAEQGFEVLVTLGGALVGSQVTGEAALTVLIRNGSALLGPVQLSWMAHQLLIATVGNIDVSTSNQLGAATYADYFGVYNPYTNGDGPGTGGGSGDTPLYIQP